MKQDEKEIKMFSQKGLKKQATFYATALLLSTATASLAACSDDEVQKVDCEENVEAEACVDEDIYVTDDYHGGGYFFFYGGVYSDHNGKYHSATGKYSYGKSNGVGKTKYTSVRAGTSKASS